MQVFSNPGTGGEQVSAGESLLGMHRSPFFILATWSYTPKMEVDYDKLQSLCKHYVPATTNAPATTNVPATTNAQ